ncbi:MAG: TRAP transporter substrate-binding protein, partial [Lachnospiraceae bacterium]
FDLPCVFDTLDDCRETIDNPEFYGLVSDVYTKGGYHLLGMADQGFRVMSTNKPVSDFSDFKGQKIRTMENSYHLSFWKSINANPTPMSFSEVYIGLQQHTIDAQENPYEVIVSNKLYEQQDYVVETNHLPHLISLIVNDEFFQKLSKDEQEIMTEAAKTATEYAREQSDERIADRVATIEESGTKIITLSDEARNEIRENSKGVYNSIKENISKDIYNAYMRTE